MSSAGHGRALSLAIERRHHAGELLINDALTAANDNEM
ncbi:hypothetical protein GALL_266700 [mine drainage metagenome]|uniref:Uncharacterized protein n=1 Tax=mine drainage metagenome TaxID=410659 RepID=A0A1J5RH08_9ZZZZ